MKAFRFGAGVLVTLLAFGCGGSSPTEPQATVPMGTLVVMVAQPCSVQVTASVRFLPEGGGPSVGGAVHVPGETRIAVPVGRYRFDSFIVQPAGGIPEVFGGSVLGAGGPIVITEGGTTTFNLQPCPMPFNR